MLKSQTTSPISVTGGDAYGARAMQAFSEGDVEKAKEIQREEDKQSAKSLVRGATLVGGGLSSKLLTDLAITGLSTAADTAIDGNFDNLGENLTLNAGLDLLGHGMFGALKKIGIQDIWAKIKHPTWQKYYHGSQDPFPIENARMGTNADMGLHMTRDENVAKHFARSNTGQVYEFYAPKPTLQTIDIHNNDITSLIGNRKYKAGMYQYMDSSSRDKLFFDALDKYGGKDAYERYNGISAMALKDYYPLTIKKDFEIPMHEVVWPNRPKEAHERLKKIYDSLPDTGPNDMAPKFANYKANEDAAKVLSDYGHKVLQYENHNPIEGLKPAYILTDPKSMHLINPKYQFDIMRPATITLGVGLTGTGLYNTINSKKQGGKLKFQPGGKITPEHARLLGRRGMPGDKEALAAAGYDSKGRPLFTFGGGSFGAAGAGATFGEGAEQIDNHDYVRNTPILQSFSDAFNNARKSGLKSFTFNGKEYTTEMSDNPNYVGKRYQPLLNIREVLDKNMKVMSDSTRIEPYVGQIPGTIKRDK